MNSATNRHRLLAVMQARAMSCETAASIANRSEATIRMYRTGARIVPDEVVEALEAHFRAGNPVDAAPPR